MTDQTALTCDEEISFLDIMVTIAESWKLLVFGPLVAGALAGGLILLRPETFESVAIARFTEEEVALLHAAPVLDPLIEKFGLLAYSDGILEDARDALKKRLVFAVDKKTKLATVTAKGGAPEAAQKLGLAAMDALLQELQPKGKEREAIEKEIAINNQMIAGGVYFLERQTFKQNTSNTSNTSKGQIANLELNNLELRLKLQVKGREVYVQEPSLPRRKASSGRSLVVIVAVLTSCFALLMWVFVQKAWHRTAGESESAEKIKRIKVALGIKTDV